MNSMIEELEKLLRAEPFHDFKVIMTDGREYAVTSPFQLSIGKTTISYYYPRTDRMAHLRKTEVTTIEASTVPGGEA
jgi:hypothetical protein